MAIDPNSLTKKYADPWGTSFDYLDSTGASLGKGYDSYADAIAKLAFSSGKKYIAPTAENSWWDSSQGEQGAMVSNPATLGGWAYMPPSTGSRPTMDGSGEQGMSADTYQVAGGYENPTTFATEQELYDYLMKQPGSPLTYESREKYGRSLLDGQIQNMYAQYASGNKAGAVPDWTYHRAAYDQNQPTNGIGLSGAQALVGSTPVFGADGKITGYKFNANPDHLQLADTSGRVTSSTYGKTTYDPSLMNYATNLGNGELFISAADADKFGYRSYGASSYNKEDSTFSKLAEMGVKAGLGTALGMAGGAAFSGLTGGSTAGGSSMFEGLGDWFSSLFSDGASASTGGLDLDSLLGITNTGQMSGIPGGVLESITGNPSWDALFGQTVGQGASLAGGSASSWLDSIINQAKADPVGNASKLLKALGGGEAGAGENNLMKLLGSLGASGLGAYASNQQSDAMEKMAQRYEGYGAPYRQKLSDLYANPDSFLKSNEVQKPVQMGTDALMRSLSTKGNPFGSGNALQQGQSYASDQLFGRLGQEKDRLAGFGGLANYNAAAPSVAANSIGSNANMYNAIGSGLGNIFNPPKTSAQTMAEFMKSMGG